MSLFPILRHYGNGNLVDPTNPRLYHANYYGQELHLHQNEKLAMYGVTYVLARDGYSGRLTAGAVMPRKNNITMFLDPLSLLMGYGTRCE